jgi:hypothetical protein
VERAAFVFVRTGLKASKHICQVCILEKTVFVCLLDTVLVFSSVQERSGGRRGGGGNHMVVLAQWDVLGASLFSQSRQMFFLGTGLALCQPMVISIKSHVFEMTGVLLARGKNANQSFFYKGKLSSISILNILMFRSQAEWFPYKLDQGQNIKNTFVC